MRCGAAPCLYGGENIGKARFEHIAERATTLLRELGPRCYNCNEVGHISKDCPRERVAIN